MRRLRRKENRPELMRGNNELILLVDDEETVRRIQVILEKNNYRVLEASDGPRLLHLRAADDSINFVLTDITLPTWTASRSFARSKN